MQDLPAAVDVSGVLYGSVPPGWAAQLVVRPENGREARQRLALTGAQAQRTQGTFGESSARLPARTFNEPVSQRSELLEFWVLGPRL